MSPIIAIVLGLSALVAVMGVVGSRTNIRLAKQLAGILEEVFRPIDKKYTNIGGVVGYHFRYETGPALGPVEGTMTFLPRHTLLYLPISLLSGRQDRLSIVAHLESSPPGHGHVVDARYLKSGWFPIEDEENMSRTVAVRDGRNFVVLWYNPLVRDKLADVLKRIPDVSRLRHFAYNGQDRTFLLELQPNSQNIKDTLNFFVLFLQKFSHEDL